MFKKEYLNEKNLDDVLPVREKAHRHLRKWSKQKLLQHLVMSSKTSWLEKWADEYDAEQRTKS